MDHALKVVALETLAGDARRRVATLHAQAMPTSLLTRLGPGIVARFYASVPRIPHFVAYAATVDGVVQGAVVGTPEPNAAFDAVARPLWRFAAHVLRHRPHMLVQLAYAKLRPAHDVARPADSVELMYIFAAPEARGRGVGRALVERFAEASRARGAAHVTLSVEVDNASAIALYERMGFTISAAHQREGETLCHRMTLTLEPGASTMRATS